MPAIIETKIVENFDSLRYILFNFSIVYSLDIYFFREI